MDSLVVFDTEDSNYLDRQPMVKMASKESSPPPSFLEFAVHEYQILRNSLPPSNFFAFFNPKKNKHPNLYSKTPN